MLRLLEARKIEEEESSAAIEEKEAKEAKAAEEATEAHAGARAAKGAKERADLADRVRRIDAKPKGWKGEAIAGYYPTGHGKDDEITKPLRALGQSFFDHSSSLAFPYHLVSPR